jgi:hypothetical protein
MEQEDLGVRGAKERQFYMTFGAERNEVNLGTEWNKRTFALQVLRKGNFI